MTSLGIGRPSPGRCWILALALAGGLLCACGGWVRGAEPFQLFVLGGSTAAGVPYGPRLDLGRAAAFLLGDRLADRPIRVINLARSGTDSWHALEQAREALAQARPGSSALLLYLGDNEFLRFDAASPESRLRRSLFDEPICSPAERAGALVSFEENLRAVAGSARERGVAVILSTVAVNLRDWDPNRSVLQDPAQGGRVEAHLARAEEALGRGDLAAQEGELRALLELEPDFAWAWFLLGRSLHAQGRLAEAREAFQRRVDSDAFPTSTLSSQNAAIRRLAEELGLPLLDAEDLIGRASAPGIPGFDWFWDNCHPTREGVLAIAGGLAEILSREFEPGRRPQARGLAELDEHFGFDAEFLRTVTVGRAQYCYVNSLLSWNREHRLARADLHLAAVLAADPDDVQALCSRAVLRLMQGDLPRSRDDWQRSLALNPRIAGLRVRHPMVQLLAGNLGVADAAELLQ